MLLRCRPRTLPNCGGEQKIDAIQEQPEIEKILRHLSEQARAPPRHPRAWTGPAGRLSAINHRRLSDLTTRVAAIACVQDFSGLSNAALRPA